MKEWMFELNSLDELETLKQKDSITIFTFSAPWCPDCRYLDGFIQELINKYDQYNFVYIDRDRFIEACKEMEVMGIPSFVAYKDNQEIGRFVSKMRKTKDEIDEFLGELR
ncbi:MAG: thioredoxin family protein [Erysipelotrichaceae bacterium]